MKLKNEVILYKDSKGSIAFKTDPNKESLWATQAQIASAFDVLPQAVTKHLKNIYKEGELDKKTTCSKMEQVQNEGGRKIVRNLDVYNLDAIIAVGYRVNSKKATAFRIWATKTLRDYIVKGYVVEAKRLKESTKNSVKELQKMLGFIQESIQARQLNQSEIDGLLSVVGGYTNSWMLLQKYDESLVSVYRSKTKETRKFEYEFVRPSIDKLKDVLIRKSEASDLFGNERDGSFAGILKTIYQTFGGKELYTSLEEKAAHLLYFIIKDHPFSDGNKRIAAFSFVLFLQENKILFRKNGERKINDNALVALALLIAQSKPGEKDQMIALVTQLLA